MYFLFSTPLHTHKHIILANPFSPSKLSRTNFLHNIQNRTFSNEKVSIDQTKQTTEDFKKVKFSQICTMKSMGSSWENLTIQLELKGLSLFSWWLCLYLVAV